MEDCIHVRFRDQALKYGERVGLVCGDVHVTYEEIERRSLELSHRLLAHGLGIEGRVAIMLPRSPELVSSILATLEAGGAYIPIDPQLPQKRIEYLLADSRPSLIVTSRELQSRLGVPAATVILVDSPEPHVQHGAIAIESAAPDSVVADNLAYLLYTSGTTGAPKGVLVTHGSVTRLFDAFQHLHPIGTAEIWSQLHSPSFDFSVWEMWGALLHGGRLVLVAEGIGRDPAELLKVIGNEQVSFLNLTPSVFYQLTAAARREPPCNSNVRTVVFGGERLNFSALGGLERLAGTQPITAINMYGITETTVHVTFRLLSRDDAQENSRSLIGQPLPGMKVELLAANGAKVRSGQPGEMLVGGAGVSRGYWDRPEETAAKFIPDAWGVQGARAYKSGDLGRLHPDGDLEYLGRADDQVKIHGHRIELGEIGSRLAAHDRIQDVAVCVHGQDSRKQIVAYFVSPDATLTAEELRTFAAEFLPSYMIPHVFFRMESIPLNENGKVDKRCLPLPRGRPQTGVEHAAPTSPTEQALVEIWEQVLEISGIGIHDNFFILGGDSIKSIQVVSLAHERGLNLSVAAVFNHGTVSRLAEYLEDARRRDRIAALAAPEPFALLPQHLIQHLPSGLVDAFPASLMLQSLIFQSGFNDHYEVYVTSIRIRGRFCAARLEDAIRRQTELNEYLRMSFFFPEDGPPVQLIHATAPSLLRIEDWRHVDLAGSERELRRWLDSEKRSPFDWTRAPHVRFTAHLLPNDIFQLTVADASLDGWAVATLITELLKDYARLLTGSRVTLSPVATRYAEFAALEQAILASEDTTQFWREQIRPGLSQVIPRSAPGGAHAGNRSRLRVELGPELTNRLRSVARDLQVPIRSVLLASHVRALQGTSAGESVVTGLELNGRPEGRDGDRIIGSFNNIVPFKVTPVGLTWRELVARVFEHEKRIMPHRRYPYAQLQRINSRKPLFDTVFVYTDFYLYDALAHLEELEIVAMDASDHTYFPLTVHFNMESSKSVIHLAADYDSGGFPEACVATLLHDHVKHLEIM